MRNQGNVDHILNIFQRRSVLMTEVPDDFVKSETEPDGFVKSETEGRRAQCPSTVSRWDMV